MSKEDIIYKKDMEEYKLIEEKDIELMRNFVDDENTNYDVNNLKTFIENENCYGFITKKDYKIVAFAYGYTMLRPDGKTMFYLHAIDVMKKISKQWIWK